MTDSIRTIDILAFPGVQLLDVSGPLQVFASANELARQAVCATPYRLRVVAAIAGPVVTSSGLALVAQPLPTAPECSDTLIVAGGSGVQSAMQDAGLIEWLRGRAVSSRRVASVCTGAFLLAAAGLLDGRRVVTHWAHCETLARHFPTLRVEPDPIFIHDGPIWTSAGVTAGIDLALALVEEDLGSARALEVAQHLVVFLKRPGGQAQFSAALTLQAQSDQFGELHGWIAEHLTADLSVAVLAARIGMSERSFMRHYRAKTGTTPARAVEQIRIEAVLRLLVETTLPIKRIADHCGFGSEETLRRSLLRTMAITPQAYRERFSSRMNGEGTAG